MVPALLFLDIYLLSAPIGYFQQTNVIAYFTIHNSGSFVLPYILYKSANDVPGVPGLPDCQCMNTDSWAVIFSVYEHGQLAATHSVNEQEVIT
jgi:hypothetical protein